MKRRLQCPARPTGYTENRWQCQCITQHQSPHKASYSNKSRSHVSWKDEDSVFEHESLPGTIRYRPPIWTTVRALRNLEWAVYLWLTAGLWRYLSPAAAAGFFVALLLSVRRTHFLDFGRFTVGVWRIAPTSPAPIVGIGWMLHGKDRTGPKAGLDMVIGRVGMGAFALMRREEWAEFKRDKAKGLAGKVDWRS